VSETREAGPLPQAGRRRTLSSGLIWALPLAAALIVVYLFIQWLAERGEVVTVTFDRAGGARAGETKVIYQGVEAGHLIKIVPNQDGRRLDFKLRLVPEAKPGLNTNARFYLIGASPTLDLNSLRAVISGVAVGYAPGAGGTPTDRFQGSDRPPTILPGERGTRYLLTARNLGSIHEGSVLLFHGQLIGKVSEVQFAGESGFRLEVFVFQPYDSLIKAGDRFWKISPLRLSLAGGGMNVNLAPLEAILSGGIEVDTALVNAHSAQSRAGSEFTLYGSLNAARQGLSGPTVRYGFAFMNAAGDLEEGAPVTLLGFQVGEVETTRLVYDQRTGKPFTTVTALLYPQQLDPLGLASGSVSDWRSETDSKLRKLIQMGFRARLAQSPPLVGARSIALVQVTRPAAADLEEDATAPRFPSEPGSQDPADIAAQADQILAKVNRVPIEEIGQNLRAITGRLRILISSPKVDDALAHLDNSSAQLDQILAQVEPQIGPLVSKLNQAAGELSSIAVRARGLLDGDGTSEDAGLVETIRQLNEAARSVRTLADYLDRHPEALIRGKRPDQ
jgi:paraquat-inducible protein B